MAQQKKKTYLEQLAVLTEKYHSKQISEKDYHMWLQVYAEQQKEGKEK